MHMLCCRKRQRYDPSLHFALIYAHFSVWRQTYKWKHTLGGRHLLQGTTWWLLKHTWLCTDGELAPDSYHPLHSPKWERMKDDIYYIRHVVKFIYELSIGLGDIWVNGGTRAIPKSTSDWLVKKIPNREKHFTIWSSYIHNCITSPHSCYPHLGTCTVTQVFVVTRQRTAPPSHAAGFWLHPWALRWCGSAG